MDDVPWTHALHFPRNRSRNHAARPVLAAKQSNVINAVEQGNDRTYSVGILQRGQRRLELRSLHRNPKHIHGRHFRGDNDVHREFAEGTLKIKLFGILPERFAPHHKGDGSARVRHTSADQAANTARSENCMPHCPGHRKLNLSCLFFHWPRGQQLRSIPYAAAFRGAATPWISSGRCAFIREAPPSTSMS